jgi:phosphate transport system substrate-binding protein
MPARSSWRSLLLPCLAWVVLALTLSACVDPVPLILTPTPIPTRPAPASLTVVASESFVPAVRAAASAYQRSFPEIQIMVVQRAHAAALDWVVRGDADAAIVAWLPDPVPDDALWVAPVARDGLAVVVHPQNGLSGMTMAQLQDLYRGQVEDLANWGGLPGAPQPISREDASGEFAFFQAWVMRDARVTLNALLAPSSGAMVDLVAEHPHGVGYVSTAWVDGRVRAVTVAGVPPARETIAGNLYPLIRTYVVATMGEPEGAARDFLQWLLDAEGQAVIERYGFVRRPD